MISVRKNKRKPFYELGRLQELDVGIRTQYLHSYLCGIIVNSFSMENGHGYSYVASEVFHVNKRIEGSIDILLCEKESLSKGILKPVFVEVKTSSPPRDIWEDICQKSLEFENTLMDAEQFGAFLEKNELNALKGLQYKPGTAEFVVFSYRSTFDKLFSLPYKFNGAQDPKSMPLSVSVPHCKVILWALEAYKGIDNYRVTYAYGNIGGIEEWEKCGLKTNNYCINTNQNLVKWLVNGEQNIDSIFSVSKPEVIDRYVNLVLLLKTSDYFLSRKLRFTEETAVTQISKAFLDAGIHVSDKYSKELFELMRDSGIIQPQYDPISTYKVRENLPRLVRNLGKIQWNTVSDISNNGKEDLILFLSKFKYRKEKARLTKPTNEIQTHFENFQGDV